MTEDSLRQLKAHVAEAVGEYKKNSQSVKGSEKGSEVSKKEIKERQQEEQRNVKGDQDEKKSNASKSKATTSSKGTSETSSVASKSVYHVEGDDDDEWATLVKFDTELFKKEKELEKIR